VVPPRQEGRARHCPWPPLPARCQVSHESLCPELRRHV
jgi:hypothetical protein